MGNLAAPRLVSVTVRRHRIPRFQLLTWRRALKVEGSAGKPVPAFVPVVPVPEPAPRRRAPRQAAQSRMLTEVGRGRRVAVDGAVDAEAFARVLAVPDRR